jgi:hypothetical protein
MLIKAGSPPENSQIGLNAAQLERRAELVKAFRAVFGCKDLPYEDGYTDLVNNQFMPWLLSNKDVAFFLKQGALQVKQPAVGAVSERQMRSDTNKGSVPHANVTTPEGLVIGSLFAHDPNPSAHTEGVEAIPVYDVDENSQHFLRTYQTLLPGSLQHPSAWS